LSVFNNKRKIPFLGKHQLKQAFSEYWTPGSTEEKASKTVLRIISDTHCKYFTNNALFFNYFFLNLRDSLPSSKNCLQTSQRQHPALQEIHIFSLFPFSSVIFKFLTPDHPHLKMDQILGSESGLLCQLDPDPQRRKKN
jgi:hypothetical protein